jgi:hypothetical protein
LGDVERIGSESDRRSEGGTWRRFVDARHRDSFGPSLELGEGQTTRVPNQIKLSRHFAARTVEPVAAGSGTVHAQWTSDRVAKEALFESVLLGEYLESLDLVIEALDGDANAECEGIDENPTQGSRKWLRGKYPEVTSATALF